MPLSFRLPGARLARSRLLVFCLAGLGAALAILPFVGRFLYVEDPLQRSDAILVLAGTLAERPLEAYDLYRTGYAPVIVLSRGALDGGQLALARRAIPFPDPADLASDLLVRLGVPATAIVALPRLHESTADEARSIRDLVRARGWRRVIVVTSKLHTRRARMTIARQLNDLHVQVIARASRYDISDPVHYWRQRSDIRFALFELEKFIAYCIGGMW
jgi:uncharacterized SAM-binding protein YcdF (DUF218 family)